MNIYQTKVCLDCDETFAGIRRQGNATSQDCPSCGSTAWTWLMNILARPQGRNVDLRVNQITS